MDKLTDASEKRWCTPCGAWRRVRFGPQIGAMCATCGSGRVRPPLKGETIPHETKPPE